MQNLIKDVTINTIINYILTLNYLFIMRRRFRRKPKRKLTQGSQLRANDRIKYTPVMLIDEKGEHRGEVPLKVAKEIAIKAGLDLVEVSPKARPPVCKILDYGKLQYVQSKQQRQQQANQKKTVTKGIRIGIRTDSHDLDFKKKQAEKFLEKGNKVKLEIILRGREKAHQDLAKENMLEFLDIIGIPYKIEDEIKKVPRGFNVVIAPIN